MATQTDQFIPTRQSLLSRLKDWNDQQSWRKFFDTYARLIYGVAQKAGLGDAEAQDVVQETMLTVAKEMPGFKYDPAVGSFKGWLLNITRHRIIDQFRKKRYERGGQKLPREERLGITTVEEQAALAGCELDQVWEEQWKETLLQAALERVKQRVNPKHYQVFYLLVIGKLPVREVRERLGVSLPLVYFAKHEVAARIKKEVTSLERQGF